MRANPVSLNSLQAAGRCQQCHTPVFHRETHLPRLSHPVSIKPRDFSFRCNKQIYCNPRFCVRAVETAAFGAEMLPFAAGAKCCLFSIVSGSHFL